MIFHLDPTEAIYGGEERQGGGWWEERGGREGRGERRAGAKYLQPLDGGVGGRREREEGGGETRREGLVNTAPQSRVFFRRRKKPAS